jgi:polyferredoxin
MNNHLTSEQISRWLIGEKTPGGEKHLRGCARCAAEVDAVRHAFSEFGNSAVNWADREGARAVPDTAGLLRRSRHRTNLRRLRLLAAAALLILMSAVPIYRKSLEQQHEAEVMRESAVDTELLERVNAHLLQTVPVSLQPLTTLASGANGKNEGER